MKILLLFFLIVILDVSEVFPLSIGIEPGTKWCGPGNDSNSEDDLGLFFITDRCCREHDMCPDNMPAETSSHGLYNDDSYTKSHCDCDQKFYKCLKDAHTPISIQIGEIYFTILRPECFNQTYPIIKCKKKFLGQCVEYKFNTTAEPIYWQWFDNPLF